MKREYAQGGLIPKDHTSATLTIERVGQTADGKCLYSINGGAPERILTRAEARRLLRAFDGRPES